MIINPMFLENLWIGLLNHHRNGKMEKKIEKKILGMNHIQTRSYRVHGSTEHASSFSIELDYELRTEYSVLNQSRDDAG